MADKIIASPAGDGIKVGFRYMPDDYEPGLDEVVMEEPPTSDMVWDGGPRLKTNSEVAQVGKQETFERLAVEAADSLGLPGGPFINPDDVIGLVASVVKRIIDQDGVNLNQNEQYALDLLHNKYAVGVAKKAEVEEVARKVEAGEADPENFDDISWEG